MSTILSFISHAWPYAGILHSNSVNSLLQFYHFVTVISIKRFRSSSFAKAMMWLDKIPDRWYLIFIDISICEYCRKQIIGQYNDIWKKKMIWISSLGRIAVWCTQPLGHMSQLWDIWSSIYHAVINHHQRLSWFKISIIASNVITFKEKYLFSSSLWMQTYNKNKSLTNLRETQWIANVHRIHCKKILPKSSLICNKVQYIRFKSNKKIMYANQSQLYDTNLRSHKLRGTDG